MSTMANPELCVVTGVAGFIGSHLAERLLGDGYRVRGVDCFTGYYDRSLKEANLSSLTGSAFEFVAADLCEADLGPLLEGASYVFHEAGQPGVGGFGPSFVDYARHNILATQRVLEAARACAGLKRIVYASSSSVYGDSDQLPLREDARLQPVSPYGVTKLAGEHLVRLYATVYGLPTIALRYFTVYGPRQRPDMGFHRFLWALYKGDPIQVYGDGEQTRDFTFVADAVQANILAMTHGQAGDCVNIGGGSRVTLNACLRMLAEITGRTLHIVHLPPRPGDMRHTWADTYRARETLGFVPQVTLAQGLQEEDAWFRRVILRAPTDQRAKEAR